MRHSCSAARKTRRAAAFAADRFEQIDRLDLAIAGLLSGQRDDLADTRRQQDTFPDAAFTRTKRPLNLGMNTGKRCVGCPELFFDRRIVLVEEREEHVFHAHVIMIVVAALLFGCP